ncbi:hypothetical protein O181_053082 [Austropuccinia psidii MF-1]|uniref:Uncharacterized protein n=1 Tax=Austropuccinia psidii MF-1 TaxID=1389203 RepID=A0A9Q3E480_9BASI|nr:hypothetical protein [Austropuccinia psidii MF-1]
MDGIHYHPNLKSKKQGLAWQEKGESKEEAPVASTSKPQAIQPSQEGKNKRRNWRKPYSPSYRVSRIQKYSINNVFNMARTLIQFKKKVDKRMRQPHLPKKSFFP